MLVNSDWLWSTSKPAPPPPCALPAFRSRPNWDKLHISGVFIDIEIITDNGVEVMVYNQKSMTCYGASTQEKKETKTKYKIV